MKLIEGTKIFSVYEPDGLAIKSFAFEEFKISPDCRAGNFTESHYPFQEQDFAPDTEKCPGHENPDALQQKMEQGYSDGYKNGYNEALESFRKEFALLDLAKKNLDLYRIKIIAKVEPDMIRLAQHIAEKIIREKINAQDDFIKTTISFAIKQISQLGKVIIYLNPEDNEYLKTKNSGINEIISNFEEIKFVEDNRIEKGGCIIETENGNIDAQPTSQLKNIDRILTDALNPETG